MLLARWIGPHGRHWTLPGGGLDFGEHPQAAALRELHEETGYTGELDALLHVETEHFVGVEGDHWYVVRIIYRGRVTGGELTHELDGSTDRAEWVAPADIDRLDAVPLVGVGRGAAHLAGYPLDGDVVAVPVPYSRWPSTTRLAAYGVIRDHDRVLLVRAGPGTTWSGRWILPGGGADHGEDLGVTVRREVAEKTGLDIVAGPIRRVMSDVVDSAPREQQIWTVRFVCDATIVGGALRTEIDGSTDDVRWFGEAELERTPLVPFVREVLDRR